MPLLRFLIYPVILVAAVTVDTHAYDAASECDPEQARRYVFSWPIAKDCNSEPRGGTSKGGEVTFQKEPDDRWLKLQEPKLSKFERDRRAILAMQGGYKVSFDFLETLGFSDGYQQDRPYQSWGTEYIYVLADEPEFISLQHIMVMVFEQKDGTLSEPMVMKHWRQDWRYEDTDLLEYIHDNQWVTRELSKAEVAGKWTQAVFQVDDSPRYESIGEWQHNGSFSSWKSALTRRPLPRREHSVRQDYDVLEGTNTHVVSQHGWQQVEENWKLKTDAEGNPDTQQPYLAKEQGMARYQPIIEFDFGPGDEYMEKAGGFWSDVRNEWSAVFTANPQLRLKKKVDGMPIFVPLFEYAQKLADGEPYKQQEGQQFVAETISAYLDD